MYQFAPHLEAAGATIEFLPFFDEHYLEGYFDEGRKRAADVLAAYRRRLAAIGRVRGADLVWVEKEVFPFLPGPAERAFGMLGAPYVVDYDDAIFHNYDLSKSTLVRRLLGRKLDALLRDATLVTAGSDYLANYATAHGAPHVELIPTVVDLDRYPLVTAPDGGTMRVGWIGTPANAQYLRPFVAALNQLGQERPVTLVTVGAGDVPGLTIPQERHAWSEDSEARLLGQMHIGVMPLPDEPWERGKCAYKLIQYMAAGRPVIASPVGMNAQVVTPDVGFLADDQTAWLAALRIYSADPDRREAMGRASRRRVASHYSLAVAAPKIIDWFASIIGRRA